MAENSRLVSEEETRKQLAQLRGQFEPGKWSGTAEDVFQAYAELAEVHVRNFPDELKLAMADYDRGQFDAKTREQVQALTKHMHKIRPEQQWGSQQAINSVKGLAARALIEDPGYSQQRSEYQQALTDQNERHLDMIYQAERDTLQALGLDPDHSPDGSRQSERMKANLDLAETYSDYRHNLEAFVRAQADLVAAIGEDTEREVEAPAAAKTDVERISEQLEKYKQSIRENGFDRRNYDFQLTPGAYLEHDRAKLEKHIDADRAQDSIKLQELRTKENGDFLCLVATIDETIRDEEREQFEATGQPEPAEQLARQALRAAFYIEAIQEFVVHESTLQHAREEALSLAYDDNSSSLQEAYEELRNSPEIEKALQDAKAQIEGLRGRQADRSIAGKLPELAVKAPQLADNDRR